MLMTSCRLFADSAEIAFPMGSELYKRMSDKTKQLSYGFVLKGHDRAALVMA